MKEMIQNNKIKRYIMLIPYLVIAIILGQTLFYKFSGHQESVDLFNQLQLAGLPEMYGRVGTGILELITIVSLFFKKTRNFGLLMALVLMGGAIYFHATTLGTQGKMLPLFISALVAFTIASMMLIRNIKLK